MSDWVSMPLPGGGGMRARVRERDGRRVITELYLHADEITSTTLRSAPVSRLEAMVNTPAGLAGSPRKPPRRPDGTNPEAFYRQVAQAYSEAVVTTSKPAKVLADEAGVPVGTVHRWIREARRRGCLPPARQGRAG